MAFEIWNIYLSKFVRRYGGKKLERTRDLFEQALENCPAKFCKPLYLMYAKLEEEHGLAKRARWASTTGRVRLFRIRTSSTCSPSTSPRRLPTLVACHSPNLRARDRELARQGDGAHVSPIRGHGAQTRRDRPRQGYLRHASQFCDPRVEPEFWSEWNSFESKSPVSSGTRPADRP